MSASQTMIDIPTVTSGRFLTLPPTAKVLYFYLLMFADDDGIVDAYVPLQISHTQFSDLNELEQKGYIIYLEKPTLGFLPDYLRHNRNLDIRSKKDSIYLPLLAEKIPDAKIMVSIAKGKKNSKQIMPVSQYMVKESENNVPALADNQNTGIPMEITGNPTRLNENAMAGNTAADMAANTHLHANITQHNLTQHNLTQLTQHNITEGGINLCTLEDLKAAGFSGLSLSKLCNAIHKDPITKKEFQQYVNDSKTKHNPMGYLHDAILKHYRPL
ncbi:hypothetical protein [uncultured Megasphaera sp.]|uniref:hypothetical protein n=1 Tax=uncultured Megasphaera sp. TaxID=165188 RepID=UPI002615135A|nr:hypothetical protein [uncultured Megasphaera sp.]